MNTPAEQINGIPEALPPGTRLGQDFTILRVLGQGGFGITYLARDEMMGEVVVIKENMPAEFAMRDRDSRTISARPNREEVYDWARERFLDEARLLHKLHHTNIVPVTRAFSALNTAYYVMPHVGATELDAAVRNAPNGRSEAYLAPLLRQLLDALTYIHAQNLLHRDLKPANILMTAEGTPIIIDFGAARATVSSRTQTMLESPGYTPFEQLKHHGNIGPWTDLYSLGATFYRLITGNVPPRSIDRLDDEESPYEPLADRADLQQHFSSRFLAGIDKALAIRIEQRWQTAAEWANDLPVPQPATIIKEEITSAVSASSTTVVSPSPTDLTPQPTSNKLWMGLSAVSTLLVFVLAGYIFMLHHTAQQQFAAQETTTKAAQQPNAAEEPQLPIKQNTPHSLSATFLRGIQHDNNVESVAFSPDSKYVATGSKDNTALITEVATGNIIREIKHYTEVESVAFSSDGKYLATGSGDYSFIGKCYPARITEVSTGNTIREIKHNYKISNVTFSPDGKYVATSALSTTLITEIATGNTVQEIKHVDGVVESVAFSPDGKYLAVGGNHNTARIIEIATGRTIRKIKHNYWINSVAFSPDGKYVATGSQDDTALITEVATGKSIRSIEHSQDVTCVAFSPDGKFLATGSDDHSIRLTEIASGRTIQELKNKHRITCVAFSPNGKFLATGGLDDTALIYELK